MNFRNSIKKGYAQKRTKNPIRAKSLAKSAEQAVKTARLIPLNEVTIKSVFRELYEGLRQYCEAIGFAKGYKFNSHEVITYFLKEVLKQEKISMKFDRYRRLRHGINYYGEDIDISTVQNALKEIPEIIQELKQHLDE